MTATSRAWVFIVTAVVLIGAVLRMAGLTTLELWSDEARWCEHLLHGTGTWFRPAGYMWLTRQILEVVGVSEPALRSLSTVAGISLLPMMVLLLRRAELRPAVVVVMTWLLAIHPVAVAMSKEFKPYIVEALLHALLMLLTLRALGEQGRVRWLAGLCATSVVAPLFAWTVVFAYPGIYLVVGIDAWRTRHWRRLAGLAAGATMTLGVLVGIFLARLATKTPATEAWGRKYDVFYVGDDVLAHVGWFIEKTATLASFPSRLEMPWPGPIETIIHVIGGLVVGVGCVSLATRRRWRDLGLWVSPWVVLLAFNAIGAWPYGLFRTNTFMLVYTLGLMAFGADAIVNVVAVRRRWRPTALACALALFFATFPLRPAVYAHKGPGTMTSESSVRAALEQIYAAEEGQPISAPIDDERLFNRIVRADPARRDGTDLVPIEALPADAGVGRPLLVLDGHACTSMRYYRDLDEETRAVFGEWLPAHFVSLCSVHNRSGWTAALHALVGRDFWLIAAKTAWPKLTRRTVAPFCEIDVDVFMPPSTHLLHCRRRPDLEPAAGDSAAVTETDDDDDDD